MRARSCLMQQLPTPSTYPDGKQPHAGGALAHPMVSPTQPWQSKCSVSADSSNYHIIWIDLKPLAQINTRQWRHVTLQRKTQRLTDACACRDRQKCGCEDEFMHGRVIGRAVFWTAEKMDSPRLSAHESAPSKTASTRFMAGAHCFARSSAALSAMCVDSDAEDFEHAMFIK